MKPLDDFFRIIHTRVENRTLAARLEQELRDHAEDAMLMHGLSGEKYDPSLCLGDPATIAHMTNMSQKNTYLPLISIQAIFLGFSSLLGYLLIQLTIGSLLFSRLSFSERTSSLLLSITIGTVIYLYLQESLRYLWSHDLQEAERKTLVRWLFYTPVVFLSLSFLASLPMVLQVLLEDIQPSVDGNPLAILPSTIIHSLLSLLAIGGYYFLMQAFLRKTEDVSAQSFIHEKKKWRVALLLLTLVYIVASTALYMQGSADSPLVRLGIHSPLLIIYFFSLLASSALGIAARGIGLPQFTGMYVFFGLILALFVVLPVRAYVQRRRKGYATGYTLLLFPLLVSTTFISFILLSPDHRVKAEWHVPAVAISDVIERRHFGPLLRAIAALHNNDGWYTEYTGWKKDGGFIIHQRGGYEYQVLPQESLEETRITAIGNLKKHSWNESSLFLPELTAAITCDGQKITKSENRESWDTVYALNGQDLVYIPCRTLALAGHPLATINQPMGFGGLTLSEDKRYGLLLLTQGVYGTHDLFVLKLPEALIAQLP